MRIKSIFHKLDIFVQVLILTSTLFSGVVAIFDSNVLLLYLLGLFVLGAWQLTSALLQAVILRDRFRGVYLLSSLVYCTILYLGSSMAWDLALADQLKQGLFLLSFCIIPTAAGIFYLIYSLQNDGIVGPKSDFV